MNDYLSGSTITGALVRPTWNVSSEQLMFLLGLASDGVYQASPVARTAGELLPHRFSLTCALGPSAVFSLLHYPSAHAAWGLPSILLCEVRTFLDTRRTSNRSHSTDSRSDKCIGTMRQAPAR